MTRQNLLLLLESAMGGVGQICKRNVRVNDGIGEPHFIHAGHRGTLLARTIIGAGQVSTHVFTYIMSNKLAMCSCPVSPCEDSLFTQSRKRKRPLILPHELRDIAVRLRKNASFFEFSLSLSRACLGKMIICYKWLKKTVLLPGTPAAPRPGSQRPCCFGRPHRCSCSTCRLAISRSRRLSQRRSAAPG